MGWTTRVAIASLHLSLSRVSLMFRWQSLKSHFTASLYDLGGRPRRESTSRAWILLDQSDSLFLDTCLNQRSRPRDISSVIRVIPSLDLSSALEELSPNEELHIQRIITYSVLCSLWMYSGLAGQDSLPQSKMVCIQDLNREPLTLRETALEHKRGFNSLNFFQPHCTLVIEADSTLPLASSMSPR